MKKVKQFIILLAAAIGLGTLGYIIWLNSYEFIDPTGVVLQKVEYLNEGDEDKDGLTNKEEKEYGTNITYYDTDDDGIDDYSEIYVSKTNPLKEDSDGDSLLDGAEIAMGLDPLKKKTDGKTDDNRRKFNLEFKEGKCKLAVEGDANISNIHVGTLDICNISNLPGVTSELYEFYMEDMKFDKAIVSISYDDKLLEKNDRDENNLAIYQLLDNGTYKEVGGTVDTENNIISAELEHFSKYFVADRTVLKQKISKKVFLLLDNSGSMYSCYCQEPDCDGKSEICDAGDANDTDFKRVDMAKALIELGMEDDISFGLAKFTKNYMELKGGFNNTKESLIDSLESIKTTKETFNGTYIANAISGALSNFEETDDLNRKFIVLLTDGATTEGSGLFNWVTYDEDDAILDAQKKNVAIIVVGLGNSVDTEYLRKIAENTGGAYIYANDSEALEKVHKLINEQINYNMVDSDGDGINDRILVADSGFDVTKDSLYLKNPCVELTYDPYGKNANHIQGGFCYGISVFQQLYYSNKLPLKVSAVEEHNGAGPLAFNPPIIKSVSADISSVRFFANEGKYSNTKQNLIEFKGFEKYTEWFTASMTEKFERSETDSDKLVIAKKYRKFFENSALYKPVEKTLDKELIWEGDKKPFTKYIEPVFTFNVDTSKLNEEELETYNVLLMLHNYWAEQKSKRVKNDRIYNLNNAELKESTREDAFYMLIDDLKNGIIPMMSGPAHTINATALYRDIENPK